MTFKREGRSGVLSVCVAVLAIMMVFGLSGISEAADATAAGVVSARAFDETSIMLRMPYTGDDNGNSTYTVEFKPCSEETYTLWITNAPHASSPYITTITGLAANTCYDIKATFNDTDNAAGPVTRKLRITSTWDNTLLHNANRFPSSGKWTTEGGWGLPNTKYGQINCETCHAPRATNIMGISGNITAPNGTEEFPGQTGGLGITFRSKTTPDGFGDDTGGHSESKKICEYCHLQTTYHRYNTTGQTYLTHNNDSDCLVCHPHAVGFYYATGDCDSCHGNPPVADSVGGPDGLASSPRTWSETPGAHSAHTAKSVACTSCHYNSVGAGGTHRDSSVTLGFYAFDGGYQGGAYDGQTTVSSYNASTTTPATIVSKTGTKTCSNIYCHGATMASNGGTDTTPVWDSPATGACGACHGATAATPPVLGSHTKHAGSANGGRSIACPVCHYNYGSTHVNNESNVAFDTETYAWLSGASYSGDTTMLNAYGNCSNLYCHSNANPAPNSVPSKNEPNEYKTVTWGQSGTLACDSCHRGKLTDTLTMRSNGHDRLAGKDWIRKYPCEYCHAATIDADYNIIDQIKHGNNFKDVVMSSRWAIVGRGDPEYNSVTKVCSNVYCHSDGTTDPEQVRPFGWTESGTHCNTCHGHPRESCSSSGCHDGRIDGQGREWPVKTGWPAGEEWKEAMPMFPNEGAGTARANSHPRHLQTNFPCDKCHYATIKNGTCTTANCHDQGIPSGSMSEVSHIDPAFHVNKEKDVVFKEGGTFNKTTKTCSNTVCHTGGTDPQWGGSINTSIICLNCHGTTGADVDDFEAFNNTQAKISLNDWAITGHGRPSSAGPYPVSGNPAANFPGNPCWYCHDNTILHRDANNPFRLRLHQQFGKRFEKECVYCHMQGLDSECLGCHNTAESLAPQLTDITNPPFTQDHTGYTDGNTSCVTTCHNTDETRHHTDAGIWTPEQKNDIKNQYMMMGVCLKCHDDDTDGKCTVCHTGPQYVLGFDPGTGFITAQSKATSVHFGYKHYAEYVSNGVWKGGKFCWDCHDPHGDQNIYMIHKDVATTTDGTFGKPLTRAEVEFTNNIDGSYYAKYESGATINGICNVCHTSGSQHYRADGGDGHNIGRKCTNCHEHRFTDSHASGQICNTCHQNKPVPRHSGFGLPRDCTKCHAGTIGMRMDVMGQLKSNSHHIQGVTADNKHCYACHWESTPEGLIDITRHQGYNYKTHTTVKNAEVDLVVWGPGTRPTTYQEGVTGVKFLASNIGTANERAEVSTISVFCLSCHSDQNNDTQPFDDCKTPRQYAWDKQSIAARYSQTGTTTWGKYTTTAGAAPKNLVKAYSAHGNAVNNEGGWSAETGYDGAITNTRAGDANVQCFDCHSSHGSKVTGVTSSYATFNGTNNGANLKETQAGKGGYSMSYKATSNPNSGSVNPYGAGAGQCFDCHETANKGTTPWGYNSTFGATAPIMGYKDTSKFGQGTKGSTARYAFRESKTTIMGGHLKASSDLAKDSGAVTDGSTTTLTASKSWTANAWKDYSVSMQSGSNNGQMRKIVSNTTDTLTVEEFPTAIVAGDTFKIVPYATAIIGGLCTPCHDPHGVSPTLGASNQAYAVPLLKGTWMTSPYKEDAPPPDPTVCSGSTYSKAWGYGNGQVAGKSYGAHNNGCYPDPQSNHYIDKNTFGGANTRMTEDDQKFAGLCLTCHQKSTLTDGTNKNTSWKSKDRIHEAVKGWGENTEHSYACSKCHQVHNSGLPRLMQTDCLDHKHRGQKASGGVPWGATKQYSGARTLNVNYGRPPAEMRGYPVANIYSNSASYPYETSCHFNAPSNSGTWPDRDLWNSVTPW